jgi:glycerate 2-kinase
VVAVGKAAAAMAVAAEAALGSRLMPSLAIGVASRRRPARIPFIEAGHPLPDERGLEAARAVEGLVDALGTKDLLLVLLSGGASALLPAPAPGLRLSDKIETTRRLLHAGADIRELNVVRKHLSRLKGGGLARRAAPARVVCLAISDVVGDDLSVIGSGPTAPDPTTYADACAVLARHALRSAVPRRVRDHLEAGAAGARAETPKPADTLFRRTRTEILASGRHALAAAARTARRLGYTPVVLTHHLGGEAREVGRLLGAILRERVESGPRGQRPACLLAAGETTVTVRGRGRGGRNLELAVAAAPEIDGLSGALLVSLATDGVDGASKAAGGLVTGRTMARARAHGLAPAQVFLDANDSESFLAPLSDLVITGPTATNVADIVVMLGGPMRARRGL